MKNLSYTLAATFVLATSSALAQPPASPPPAAPPPASTVPATPTPALVPADPFPPANPKYFTAPTPTVETVNSFLNQLWGYDATRLYRVMAIQTTAAPGIAKVVVFVTDTTPNAKVQSTAFYPTPDGKHAIADSGAGVIPFSAHPFAETRALLQAHADGASRGAPGKDLELVEFADLQCPHCKEAQPIMDQLVKDFPQAHVVFQLFPLVDIHSSAFKAAAYAVCAQKQSNDAFFKFSANVFDTQEALSPTTDDTVLKAAATRAALDPAALAACSETPATKAIVNADMKLADDAAVDQTPLLAVNGRMLPLLQIPYETLKQIIVFQAKLDGVPTGASSDILTPKPAQPALSTLPK